jgi:hypothetical protein
MFIDELQRNFTRRENEIQQRRFSGMLRPTKFEADLQLVMTSVSKSLSMNSWFI